MTESERTSHAGDIYSPGSVATGSYTYDKNENMTNDSRRALNLSYNVLNLLNEVKTGSTLKARYSYLADGTKLQVRDNGEANGFDYLGSLTYRKSSAGLLLESANFGDGVIRANVSNSGGNEVNYFLTDHLGSVRVIVDGNGVVKERNDYYPFGARHVRGDYPQLADNRYKFNGKEEQVTGGLDYMDYGSRMYDNGLGRWFGMDPMAEDYLSLSSYCFSGNSPICFVDPNGCWFTHYVDKDYNTLLQTHDGSDDVVMVPDSHVSNFNKYASFYNFGTRGVYDSQGWNSYWKQEFGLAGYQFSEAEISALNQFYSIWARDNAARFLLKPTFANALRMSFSEAISQWKNPELIAGGLSVGLVGWQSVLKVFAKNENVAKGVLSFGEVKRIENAATRIGKEIHLVGSRARGQAKAFSDWDYVIEGINHRSWNKIKNSLPGSRSLLDNTPRNIDLFRGKLNKTKPHITFYPK